MDAFTFLLFWVPVFILGVLLHLKERRDFRQGKIKGIPKSKGFFDWLFYNYHND